MRKKILVVDNSPVILRLMENFLGKEGHHVLCAADGLAAMEILKDFRPEVIFIDLVMPNIPGDKLCSIIRTMPELADTYIVILSAVAVEQDLDFSALGANACIAKGPFKEITQHVQTIFAAIDSGEGDKFSKDILGIESIYRRIATEELLSVKRHFDATLTHMREGFLELTPEAQIVCVNQAAAALLGQPEEKILSTYLYDFFVGEYRGLLKQCLGQLASQPLTLGEAQPLLLRDRHIALTLVTVAEQEQKSLIAILQDITYRKKAEQELLMHHDHLEELVRQRTAEITEQHQHLLMEMQRRRQVEEEKLKLELSLRQTHKMEALGTLAAGIAHDFNNILTAVIGFTELNQLQFGDNQELYDNLEQVKNAGGRAKELIKNILTFSRKKEQEFQPIQIHQLLKEVLRLIRASAQPNITISEAIDPECGAILADPTQLHQVFMNLCTNAIHAMKNTGGTLTVRLENSDLPRTPAEAEPKALVRFVKLTVSDSGTGIDPAIIDKIFDPYFTTKAPGEGTGMGLAVAHGIITSHGGEITVRSTPGAGSTFTVCLPAVPQVDAHDATPASGRIVRGKEMILLVEDDPAILSATTKILQTLGYQVNAASNGEDALRIFTSHGGHFDLVITDQGMPGLSGTELCARLFAVRPDLPIILCTGLGQYLSPAQVKAMGIKLMLQKPYYFPEIAAAVRKALDTELTAPLA